MANNSFYTPVELNTIGFKSIGQNVLISRFAHFYGPEFMEIGSHVRIDDFCILSGKIKLGSYIHISAHTSLYGQFGITLEDFSNISPGCLVFSASDDFSGDYLVGPMVADQYRNVISGPILMKKYSCIGSHSVVLPGVTIGEGTAVGAMSLVKHNLDDWKIYKGIPAIFYKDRNRRLLEFNINGK